MSHPLAIIVLASGDFAVKLRGWILNQSRKSTSNPRMRNCYSHPDLRFIPISYYTHTHSITTDYVLVAFLKCHF